jgi:hypothetical protein
MTIVLNGTTGITNDGGYTGDGVVFADTTPANTLVTTTGGNVGIGTASPAYRLDVQGGAASVYNSGASANSTIAYRNGTKNWYAGLRGDTSNAWAIADDSAFRFTVDASGNVGVGTSSIAANYKLSVNGTGNFYNGVAGLGRIFFGDPVDSNGYIGIYRSAGGPSGSATGGNWLNFASVDGYTFNTGGVVYGAQTERARISNSTGNMAIGQQPSGARLLVARNNPTAYNDSQIELYADTGDAVLGFHAAGASAICLDHVRGSVSIRCVSGTRASFANLEAAAFVVGSDYRLKENITTLDNGLSRILQLPVYRFSFKEGTMSFNEGKIVDGFLAHELADVVPEAVFGEKDAVFEDGSDNYQTVDQSKVVPLLVAAIQEQQALIQSLTDRITALETA